MVLVEVWGVEVEDFDFDLADFGADNVELAAEEATAGED